MQKAKRSNKGGLIIYLQKNTNIDYKKFIDEFTIILASLENCNSELIIAGDYNIDLLKVNENDVIGEFFIF